MEKERRWEGGLSKGAREDVCDIYNVEGADWKFSHFCTPDKDMDPKGTGSDLYCLNGAFSTTVQTLHYMVLHVMCLQCSIRAE